VAFGACPAVGLIGVVGSKVFVELVDSIVGQVHLQVVDVFAFGFLVLFGAKPQKTFVVDPHTQRVDRSDQHLQPHIEFESVDEGGGCKLFLANPLLVVGKVYILPVTQNGDSFTLALVFWLYDELPLFIRFLIFHHVILQVF